MVNIPPKHTTYIFMVMTFGMVYGIVLPTDFKRFNLWIWKCITDRHSKPECKPGRIITAVVLHFLFGGFPSSNLQMDVGFSYNKYIWGVPSGNLICQMDVNVGFSIDRFLQVLKVGNGWVAGGCWDDY